MDEKMALLAEVNKLLVTIPDYQLAMPAIKMEYDHVFITDKGYISRSYLEYGEVHEAFLGETRKEAIWGLANGWIVTYSHDLFKGGLNWSREETDALFDKMKRFRAHCDSYIYKSTDYPSLIRMGTDSAALDAINQEAAAILRKITAYNVPLIALRNDTSSPPVYWYKKLVDQWLYYNFEPGEVHMRVCAKNDDEMVQNVVFGSLNNYAQQQFVVDRERNGRDPHRKYDDFMEECLHIAYPAQKYHRLPVYDDRKYAALDADYREGPSPSN